MVVGDEIIGNLKVIHFCNVLGLRFYSFFSVLFFKASCFIFIRKPSNYERKQKQF